MTDTATLVVEVIVTGQPGFDFSTVSRSPSTARADDARPFSARTLSGRSGNLWTEPDMPPGAYTATAVVKAPQAMSGSANATLRAGATTKVTITLTPLAAIATRFIVSFRFDKAFVEPCMRHVLRQAVDFGDAHPDQKLLIVGDTDLVGTPGSPTGPDPYNQSLSERRARAVFAFVTFGRDPDGASAEWTALRARQTGAGATLADNWGTRQAQFMLQDLGFYPGRVDGADGTQTHDAVRAFRRGKGLPPGTVLDDAVWNALIRAYLGQDSFAVPAARCFTNCPGEIVKWVGVASQDPQINTRHAERRNRRVELLFVNAATLPCQEPQPDTFALPAPGTVDTAWCIGPGSDSRRACFAAPYQPPGTLATGDQWTRVPAEPGTLELDVLIEREVRQADGSVVLQPAGGTKFVVITPLGEYLAAELSSGEPQPAKTEADGSQTFADKPLGIYTLEVVADVLVRLNEDGPQDARGNAVCKHLTAADHAIHVVILADPPLREVRLPAAAHLMTALHPLTRELRTSSPPGSVGPPGVQATAHTPADVTAFFAGANDIWRQARVHFDLVDTVEEVYAFRDEGEVDDNELIVLLERCAYPNVANAFFFGDLTGSGEVGAYIFEPAQDPDGVALSDRFQFDVVSAGVSAAESTTVLAHEYGHFLSLPDLAPAPAVQNRLMMGTNTVHQLLVPSEVTAARASRNGGRDFAPLRLTVAGATQAGGTLSHEFIAVAAPGLATITAVVADGAAGTVTMSGGTPVDDTHQTVDTTSAGPPVTVSAAFAPAGGGDGFTTHVELRVVTFELDVDGATRIGPALFLAKRSAGGSVTVIAGLTPAPMCIPKNLIAWSAGSAKPDPLRRALAVAATGSTAIGATLAGTTRSATIVVAEVTLGSIALVGKNLTADVPVTIAPTPLPSGLAVTLRIGPTSGSGEARFTGTNTSTTTLSASGTVTVRGISPSSVAGNLRLSATIGSAPDAFAQQDFTVVDAAIGVFSAVGSGKTVDVPITLTPSPLPAGSSLTLTLSTTSGTGAARFAAGGLSTLTLTQTTTVTIAGVTPSSTVGNQRLTVTITGQTQPLAQADFTVLGAINFFLKFEVWNLTSRAFEPLPSGVAVDLIDNDPLSNDVLATQPTDARGRVLFNLADFSASGEATPDLFFLVHTNGRHHAAHVLPAEWSTKGWTRDGRHAGLPAELRRDDAGQRRRAGGVPGRAGRARQADLSRLEQDPGAQRGAGTPRLLGRAAHHRRAGRAEARAAHRRRRRGPRRRLRRQRRRRAAAAGRLLDPRPGHPLAPGQRQHRRLGHRLAHQRAHVAGHADRAVRARRDLRRPQHGTVLPQIAARALGVPVPPDRAHVAGLRQPHAVPQLDLGRRLLLAGGLGQRSRPPTTGCATR